MAAVTIDGISSAAFLVKSRMYENLYVGTGNSLFYLPPLTDLYCSLAAAKLSLRRLKSPKGASS